MADRDLPRNHLSNTNAAHGVESQKRDAPQLTSLKPHRTVLGRLTGLAGAGLCD